MWFRTALLLILLLLVLRIVRDVAARLGAGRSVDTRNGAASPGGTDGVRPGNGATGGGAARPGASPADWPPGEITDVPYREARTANRD
jgi:hypothetical protein